MKSLLLLLVLCSFTAVAQDTGPEKKGSKDLSAGDHFVRASKNYFTGVITWVGTSLIGTAMITSGVDPAPGLVLIGIGAIAGTILAFSAWSHIRKGGEKLNAQSTPMINYALINNPNDYVSRELYRLKHRNQETTFGGMTAASASL